MAVRRFLAAYFPRHVHIREIERTRSLPHRIRPTDAYDTKQQAIAVEYFELLGEGLHHAASAGRDLGLDVSQYVMEGGLGELGSRFLFDQLQLAAATPGFQRKHGSTLEAVHLGLERCIEEYLDEHMIPPFFTLSLRKTLRRAWSDLMAEPSDGLFMAQQRFLRLLWVTRLIEGSDIHEEKLLTFIDRALRRVKSDGLSARVVALLHYRRCLALVYLGQWHDVQAELRGTITYQSGWDPNWTAFLHFQLGEIAQSATLYSQAKADEDEAVRAVATRGLIDLLPATHSPLVVEDGNYFAALEKQFDSDDNLQTELARSSLRAVGRQRGLDREHHLGFLLECATQVQKGAEHRLLVENGRGIAIGAEPTRPVTKEFHRRWMQGLPTIWLSDRVKELMALALRVRPLRDVLELNFVTHILRRWDPKDLRDAAGKFVRSSSLADWQALLVDQEARLTRLVRFFLAERRVGVGAGTARRTRQFDAIFLRIRCSISFFAGLFMYLPDSILHAVGRMCAQLLRHWSIYWVLSREERQDWDALIWRAILRTGQTPEQMGIDPRHLAAILAGSRDGAASIVAFWLHDHRNMLSKRYQHALQRPVRSRPGFSAIEVEYASDTPMSNRALIFDMLQHWTEWRQHWFTTPLLNVKDLPKSYSGLRTRRIYEDLLRPAIEALVGPTLRDAPVNPLAWPWLERGVYGLSELLIRFADIDLWLRLFETAPLWSSPWKAMGCRVEVIRAACEQGKAGAMLRTRILQRIAMSRNTREWSALLWLLERLLEAAKTIYVEDISALQILTARAPTHRVALLILRPLTTLLGKVAHALSIRPLASALATFLDGMPERITAHGLLPSDSLELVDRFTEQLTALPPKIRRQLGETRWRSGLEMLMRWRAAHGYGEPRSDDLVEREDI